MPVSASYATLVEAQAYFDGRLNTEAWDDSDDATRNKGLCQATTIIDRLNFLGSKTDELQVLQFPRDKETIVPQDIKNASAELALALLDGVSPELEFENLFMVSQGYSSVRSSYDRGSKPPHVLAGIPSLVAWTFLKPYLRDPTQMDLIRIQ